MSPQPYTGGAADIRMVVTDMDGTLVQSDHRIPDSLWPVLDAMRERGILFVPASGRQYANISYLFPDHTGMAFVAENGGYVRLGENEIFSASLDRSAANSAIARVRELADPNVGAVFCSKHVAFVENDDDEFLTQVRHYFRALEIVPDLDAVEEDPLKIAIFSFDDIAQTVYPHMGGLATSPQVVVSARNWIDIMNPAVNKGVGLRALQEAVGVSPAHTAVFGDYLNDLDALDRGEYSFAMANAHPEVQRRARFLAPSNDDAGVVTTVCTLLDLEKMWA